MLDGVDIIAEDKAKAENLHGVDLNDRDKIFKVMLPQESFVDRRIAVYEDVEEESEDEISADETMNDALNPNMHKSIATDNEVEARQYVGELFTKVQESLE